MWFAQSYKNRQNEWVDLLAHVKPIKLRETP